VTVFDVIHVSFFWHRTAKFKIHFKMVSGFPWVSEVALCVASSGYFWHWGY